MARWRMVRWMAVWVSLGAAGCGAAIAGGMDGGAAPCASASDCRGMLPHLCKQCPTGQDGGCAHWACVDKQCQMAFCQ